MRHSLVVSLIAFAGVAFAADPVLGQWTLNVEKSRFLPGPPPKSQTRVYETDPEGIKVTIRTVQADGKTVEVQHLVTYDGKDRPLKGSAGPADAIALEKVDDYTSESKLKHANKVIGMTRRTVAQDGKTMTIVHQGNDSRGRPVRNTSVYDRK